MHMIGEDNPGGDAEGRTGAHRANRVAQYLDLRHQQIQAGVAQVHCKEGSARNPICGDNPAYPEYARPFEAAECAPLFRPTLAETLRNELVGMVFIACATYFDGILSKEHKVNDIYEQAMIMLEHVFVSRTTY